MINDITLVWAVLALIIALSFHLQKFNFFKIIGPSIICIVLGALLSNTGIMPHMHPVYNTVFTYTIPLSLSMFMLNMDIKTILTLSKKPLLAVFFALISVSTVAFLASFLFYDSIPNLYRYTGMFTATYLGGSANLAAVGTALGATASEFAAANGADYITGMPVLVLFFLLPSLIARSAFANKIFPYSLPDNELHSDDDTELFGEKSWSVTDLAMIFGLALTITWLADYLSSFLNHELHSAGKIILITTFSVILGQFKSIKSIKGSTEVAIYISSFFLVVIGLLLDLQEFFSSVPVIAIYCSLTLTGSATIYIILCRAFKIPYQYAVVAFVALIADGTTSAMIAATNNWKALVQVAIMLGVVGGISGNYAGIALGLLVKHLTGM